MQPLLQDLPAPHHPIPLLCLGPLLQATCAQRLPLLKAVFLTLPNIFLYRQLAYLELPTRCPDDVKLTMPTLEKAGKRPAIRGICQHMSPVRLGGRLTRAWLSRW